MKTKDVVFGPESFPAADPREAHAVAGISPVIVCTEAEDMARQEYKLSSDLAYQVQRFGAGLPFKSGELDTDLDLTRAFELIAESQERWLTLPRVVRDRYQSWANVERAAQSGELEQLLKTAGIDSGSSESVPAVSPSDSAAGDASASSTAS